MFMFVFISVLHSPTWPHAAPVRHEAIGFNGRVKVQNTHSYDYDDNIIQSHYSVALFPNN